MLAKYGKLFLTKLRTDRTSSHTIKVCIVGTNCIVHMQPSMYLWVCTRGIVFELFHTHLTKHHIICHRLPQLIIHFARKVSHHEWWWKRFTVSSDLDDYFSIIPYQRNTDHVNLMFLFALLLLVACIPVSCIMSSSETIHFLSFVTLNLFDTSIKILYQSRYIVI